MGPYLTKIEKVKINDTRFDINMLSSEYNFIK